MKPHTCLECGIELKDKKTLKSHTKYHHNTLPNSVFKCDKCTKDYPTRGQLV